MLGAGVGLQTDVGVGRAALGLWTLVCLSVPPSSVRQAGRRPLCVVMLALLAG